MLSEENSFRIWSYGFKQHLKKISPVSLILHRSKANVVINHIIYIIFQESTVVKHL